MRDKNITLMTKTEFQNIPRRKYGQDVGEITSIVVIPTTRKHETGYLIMDFVLCKSDIPICKAGGTSDILKLNNGSFVVDILPNSGYTNIRGWSNLIVGADNSSFDVYLKER